MRLITVIWFLFFVPLATFSSNEIDSLRRMVNNGNPDEKVLAEIFVELAWNYRDIRPDSALYFSNRSLDIARRTALKHLEIQAMNYMGVAYRNLSVYSKAFEVYLEALRLSEEYGDSEQRGYTLINLGNLYIYQTNFQGAISYFIQALDQAQALGDQRMQGYCFINLGRSYYGIGEYGQSQLYFLQAIDLRKRLGDLEGVYSVEVELANSYLASGERNEADKIVSSIIGKVNENDLPRTLIEAYQVLSRVRMDQGKPAEAEYFSKKALSLAREVSSRNDEKEIKRQLSDIYAATDDYQRAYLELSKYSELNQQLFSEENIRKIEQLKNQYETEKQEAENVLLRTQTELNQAVIGRQQNLILFAIIGIVLLVVIAALAIRAYWIKKNLSNEIFNQKDRIEKDRNTIKQQAEKLTQLDEAKSRFFANVSHDLRSPLSLILGNLEMISEDPDTVLSPKSKKNLEVGFKNSKRLIYLTDEINDLTRLEEGRINLKIETVTVNSYLQMLCDMFRATAEYKGVKLGFETTLTPTETFLIDPRQFEKIFYNLVSNAIRYTQKGDIISIKAERKSSFITIKFKDTGEGIPKDHLPYIFDRFYQSNQKNYRTKEGMGIGLALVKELVELHDGYINVSSEKGKGSEFLVAIKSGTIEEAQPTPGVHKIKDQHLAFRDLETESKIKPPADVDESKPSILLVDDHPEIRYYIRQILEDKYIVLEAAHGLEALFLLKEESIDMIITDLMMPWMDGFELIESIGKNDSFAKIPMLVVSARISEEDKEKVLYKGVNDYLQKPFSKKELTLRIENLLKQKEKFSDDGSSVFSKMVQENLHDMERDILLKLENVVRENIGDSNLSIYTLQEALAASERQVYRLVKKITGLTPHEYITEVRMQYADFLIRENKVKNASEAARNVGIKNVTTFSKQFEKKFGIRPVDLLKS